MAFTAFFMLVLYLSLLAWCSQPEIDLNSFNFNDSEPTSLDQYRSRRDSADAVSGDGEPFSHTGNDT